VRNRRRTTAIPTLAACALLVAWTATAEQQSGKITLVATGFESEKGEVLVQLVNSEQDYGDDSGGYRLATVKPRDGRATCEFESVPYGEYAIKLFHDENSNQKLDVGWTGPEERYGFSNNARGLMGPPPYEKVRFQLSSPELTLEIAAE
jgi:uncharacterized protein (DUF2141 family)